MLYLQVFVSTAWDCYFLFKDNLYSRWAKDQIVRNLHDHLDYLFEEQGKNCPDISEMVNELFQTKLTTKNYNDCAQKGQFIEKYTQIFSKL